MRDKDELGSDFLTRRITIPQNLMQCFNSGIT